MTDAFMNVISCVVPLKRSQRKQLKQSVLNYCLLRKLICNKCTKMEQNAKIDDLKLLLKQEE